MNDFQYSQVLSEFEFHDAFSSEIKNMVLFSVHNKISFDEIMSMPRSRYEYIILQIAEVNNQNNRDSNLLNSVKSSGGILG